MLATVDRNVFVTLPSPGYLAAAGSALASAADVDAVRAAGAALAAILRDEIAALAADGVLYVALENPLYVPLLTVDGRAAAAAAGIDVPAVARRAHRGRPRGVRRACGATPSSGSGST